MRALIALRAKIDLLQEDCEDEMNECYEPYERMQLVGKCEAYGDIRAMIDDMVGDDLERMYAQTEEEDGDD